MPAKNHDARRQYICLNCGERFETFERECSACGKSEFRTSGKSGETTDEDDTALFEEIAARFNPYIPR